jgi:hypothetical protein
MVIELPVQRGCISIWRNTCGCRHLAVMPSIRLCGLRYTCMVRYDRDRHGNMSAGGWLKQTVAWCSPVQRCRHSHRPKFMPRDRADQAVYMGSGQPNNDNKVRIAEDTEKCSEVTKFRRHVVVGLRDELTDSFGEPLFMLPLRVMKATSVLQPYCRPLRQNAALQTNRLRCCRPDSRPKRASRGRPHCDGRRQ